jgi:hypothetical protein
VDEGSRTTIIKKAKDLTSAIGITLCKNIFAKYGIPKVIKADNGPALTSGAWFDFAKRFNFKHQKVTPLHTAANSTAQRIMKNNNKTIRCAGVEGTPWKHHGHTRNTICATTTSTSNSSTTTTSTTTTTTTKTNN